MYTAEIINRQVVNIGSGNYLVQIAVQIKQDGNDVLIANVDCVVNETVPDKETYVKQKLETKLIQVWDSYLAQNAIIASTAALDSLCDTIKTDVENYLNQ